MKRVYVKHALLLALFAVVIWALINGVTGCFYLFNHATVVGETGLALGGVVICVFLIVVLIVGAAKLINEEIQKAAKSISSCSESLASSALSSSPLSDVPAATPSVQETSVSKSQRPDQAGESRT